MTRLTALRRAPRHGLALWQSVSASAVTSALAVAPATLVAAPGLDRLRWVAVAFSAAALARVLWSGHRTGVRLRLGRRRHRALVDALGTHAGADLRVLAHPTPTAYCLPGLRHRVVLSEGALRALPPAELDAVLAHERAHVRERHDLVLEFFLVMHRAAPPWVRAPGALREVRLLVEALADRSARRAAGTIPVARALVALSGGAHPEGGLGATAGPSQARERMVLLAEPDAPLALRLALSASALAVLLAPFGLLAVTVG
jgi:Zn-dependent protease with chaperone function